MAKEIPHEVAYYYDSHPTEEDLMGEAIEHHDLVSYLEQVLKWLFHGQVCGIYANLNFYQTTDYWESPLAPDIVVIKGVSVRSGRSWRVGQTGPAPQVVFEIASEKTWWKDLKEKPLAYGLMGVKEYIAYDPNEPMLPESGSRRLWGWQRGKGRGPLQTMVQGPAGRLWSPYLESNLVPDGQYLRLYDSQWQRRLTEAEAKDKQAREEAEARRAEARRAEMLAEKLRSLGIDPDQL